MGDLGFLRAVLFIAAAMLCISCTERTQAKVPRLFSDIENREYSVDEAVIATHDLARHLCQKPHFLPNVSAEECVAYATKAAPICQQRARDRHSDIRIDSRDKASAIAKEYMKCVLP